MHRRVGKNRKFDLAELVTELSKRGGLAAQVVAKRFYEIGSPSSMRPGLYTKSFTAKGESGCSISSL